MSSGHPAVHIFRHEAMATTFELRLVHADARYAQQGATACFAEVDRLERLLSRFDASSEVATLSRLEPGATMVVSADTFDCLRIALVVHELTNGAFDPTLGAVLDRHRGSGPAREHAPLRGRLSLDAASLAVRVEAAGVALDLGGVGKGYALDTAGRILMDWELERALLIAGGGSSVLALGAPSAGQGWRIGVGEGGSARYLPLEKRAAGGSGFEVKGGHIIDPASGVPAKRYHRSWALAPTAAEADALSTAWMCLALDDVAAVCQKRPDLGAIILPRRGRPLWFTGPVDHDPGNPVDPLSNLSVC